MRLAPRAGAYDAPMTRGRLVVLWLLLMAACDSGGGTPTVLPPEPIASPTSPDTRVIGLVGTMSGMDMWRGEDAYEGAHLAASVINRQVEEGRPAFELVTLDDRGDAARATELVEELAADDQTVGIVYAGPPEGLPPAERALTQAGIPAILCYGDLYAARLLRPHIFQASPSYLWQARTIARYLLNDRRYRTIGVLASRSLNGDTAVASMRAALQETGAHRVVVTRYSDEGDPSDLVRTFAARQVEAIVVEGAPRTFAVVAAVLERRGSSYVGSEAARVASAPPARRARRRASKTFRPQLAGFDLAISSGSSPPRGSVAADTYARGAHYLPIPSLERFRDAFTSWWDGAEPLGRELRAYDAARMIGWAAQHARPGADLARALESLRDVRFGALGVTLGPDDHTATEQSTIGLWVRPRSAFGNLVAHDRLPWVPLSRGFSINGRRTSIPSEDWRFLFRSPPPPDGPAPFVGRMRYAVTSPRTDPVH